MVPMEISSIIIDDEPHALNELAEIIDKVPGIYLMGQFENAISAIDFLNTVKHVDVIYSDINLPNLNGISAGKLLKDFCEHLIYVTAHRKYALDAFGVKASDYILKPIDLNSIYNSVNEIKRQRNNRQIAQAEKLIFIKGNNKNSFIKLNLEEIVVVEALLNYVIIHSLSGDDITYLTLKAVSELLKKHSQFYRISKSVIVNLNFIERVEGNLLKLKNGSTHTIGETYRGIFFKFLQKRTLNL